MRYTLKNYQEDAVEDVLKKLGRAKENWKKHNEISSFALSATTGAGKTVMAAAVIEAMFYGSDKFSDGPAVGDKSAVVLWFTDDPSLNEQTRRRINEASDQLEDSNNLHVIESSFTNRQLERGNVYFLNRQKLAKKGLLVRLDRGDMQAPTFWDVLRNTIEDDTLTLYVILDEAHRGMRDSNGKNEKETIVKRLVNGQDGVPPVPIVWGISATVDRFSIAMKRAEERFQIPPVVVDPGDVQESGLLKDNILLDFPTENGRFETVLLRRATRLIKESTIRWENYSTKELVTPLLVVQMPNKPEDKMLKIACEAIREEWDSIESDAMANVFGEHEDLKIGSFTIPYVKPQDVQGRPHIRVLFAKDAVSTGWDCPRAEVLMSFRPANDKTHITQLLGRMVRNPLARRIEGNDLLNSVHCVLPYFNRETANDVADLMLGNRHQDSDGTGGGDDRRIIKKLDMVTTLPNPSISKHVWEAYDTINSQIIPYMASNPVQRLSDLCQGLSEDGLRANARKDAYKLMFNGLDGMLIQYQSDVGRLSREVSEMEGQTLITQKRKGGSISSKEFTEPADHRSIISDFKTAYSAFTTELCKKYAQHLKTTQECDPLDAYVTIAALARIPDVVSCIHKRANEIVDNMYHEHRVGIRTLSDQRQDVYDQIKTSTTQPQSIYLRRPDNRIAVAADNTGEKFDTRRNHLTCDSDGNFPIGSLNKLELLVLDKEMGESEFIAWYRNRSSPKKDALSIAYKSGEGDWKRMLPDFLFFEKHREGSVRPSIVDPHGYHLSDALFKIRGLARYAEDFGGGFHRIDAVCMMKSGNVRVLDLKKSEIRETVFKADNAELLYESDVALNYT